MRKTLLRSTLLSLAIFGAALLLPACGDDSEPIGTDAGIDISVTHDLAGGDLAKNVDAKGSD